MRSTTCIRSTTHRDGLHRAIEGRVTLSGLPLGVAAVALLARPAANLAALAARPGATIPDLSAALHHSAIAPLVEELDCGELCASRGATSANLPYLERRALAGL
jgi:hypothetical protein